MRIAHVIHSLASGGAERLVVEMVHLMQKNAEVEVILLTKSGSLFHGALKDVGIPVNILSDSAKLRNPLLLADLQKHLSRFDVVHTHLFHAQYAASLLRPFLPRRVRLVTTEHCNENRRRKKTLYRPIEKWMYAQYDRIVAISDEVEARLCEWISEPLTSNRMTVITNGIDLSRFQTARPLDRSEFGLHSRDIVITMVAAFRPEKDHATPIEAMQHLPDHFHLLFVGQGPMVEKYKKLVRRVGVERRVHFLGYRSDIPEILKMSDIGLLSSTSEGVPLTLIEMMAAGLPTIGSNVAGIDRMLEGAGMVFSPKDPMGLKDLILQISSQQDIREALFRRGLDRAGQFGIAKTVQQHLSLYREVLVEPTP